MADPPDARDRGDLDAAFFERFFDRLARSGVPAPTDGSTPASWRVEELAGGRWAVEPALAEEERPGATRWELDDRRQAYLTAACLTALAALGPTKSGGELREAIAGGPGGASGAALVARILQGLVASPEAVELVLAAADPEVAAEARRLAAERLGRDDDVN